MPGARCGIFVGPRMLVVWIVTAMMVGGCIRVFGGPRSFRYVCQINLELCKSTELSVEELNSSEWKWDTVKQSYVPSDEMRVSVASFCVVLPFSIFMS